MKRYTIKNEYKAIISTKYNCNIEPLHYWVEMGISEAALEEVIDSENLYNLEEVTNIIWQIQNCKELSLPSWNSVKEHVFQYHGKSKKINGKSKNDEQGIKLVPGRPTKGTTPEEFEKELYESSRNLNPVIFSVGDNGINPEYITFYNTQAIASTCIGLYQIIVENDTVYVCKNLATNTFSNIEKENVYREEGFPTNDSYILLKSMEKIKGMTIQFH